MSTLYSWEDEIVIDALHAFTERWCGQHDEDFFTESLIQAYCNPAWEACVVMDYIDQVMGPKLEKYTEYHATIKKFSI